MLSSREPAKDRSKTLCCVKREPFWAVISYQCCYEAVQGSRKRTPLYHRMSLCTVFCPVNMHIFQDGCRQQRLVEQTGLRKWLFKARRSSTCGVYVVFRFRVLVWARGGRSLTLLNCGGRHPSFTAASCQIPFWLDWSLSVTLEPQLRGRIRNNGQASPSSPQRPSQLPTAKALAFPWGANVVYRADPTAEASLMKRNHSPS